MKKIVQMSPFSLLLTDYVQLNKNWNYKNVTSTFHRLYLIDDGAGKLSTPKESVVLEKGFLYLIPSFTTCNYSCPDFLSQYHICFTENMFDSGSIFAQQRKIFKTPATINDFVNFKRLIEINPGRGLTNSNDPKVWEKHPLLRSFQELNDYVTIGNYMETTGIILQLISRFIASDKFKLKNKEVIPSRISDAINYIQINLSKSITITELADRANVSPDHFTRMFKESSGETPLSYIQNKRMERAEFLLISTDLPLVVIAAETGFEYLTYFSRVFKEKHRQTASEYRKNNRMI